MANRNQVWLGKIVMRQNRLLLYGVVLLITAVVLTAVLWYFLGGIKNSLPKSTDYWKEIATTTELEAEMKEHLIGETSTEISLLAMLILASILAVAGPLITSSIFCFKLRADRRKFLSIIKNTE